MKIQKGDAGYLRRRKRLLILEAVVSFGLVAALVIAGYVTTKTKLNLLTVVAVLGCLPASRILVNLIMVMPHDSIDEATELESTVSNTEKTAKSLEDAVETISKTEKDLAGITCVQSERFNYVFGITKKDKDFYLLLQRTARGKSTIVASTKIDLKTPVQLRVKAVGDNYEFSYSVNGTDFTNVGGTVSGDILSTDVAGGFTGAMIGLYTTSVNDAVPQ